MPPGTERKNRYTNVLPSKSIMSMTSHDITRHHMTSHTITWHHTPSHDITWHHMPESHNITWHPSPCTCFISLACETRVVLPEVFGYSNSDYINANFIRVSQSHGDHVTAQLNVYTPSLFLGLQRCSEAIHCHSRSPREHSGRLLAHDIGQWDFSHRHGDQLSRKRNCECISKLVTLQCIHKQLQGDSHYILAFSFLGIATVSGPCVIMQTNKKIPLNRPSAIHMQLQIKVFLMM